MRKVLLLDNKDSFVWNLAQALMVLGREVEVVRSDAVTEESVRLSGAEGLVVSPGPGHPDAAGNSVAVIRSASGRLPILGVCLGHQAIATAFGGSLFRTAPCHGKPWRIHHHGTGLFRGLSEPLVACRYHSLAVSRRDLPGALEVDAETEDGLIMGLRHRTHPTFGVQFHPESFRSPEGPEILRNFVESTR